MKPSDQSLLSIFSIGLSIHNLNRKSERRSGLSLAQWCLLRHLIDMPAVSAFALAKAVGVHPSTLTQTLKRLERKNFIFVTEDPKDFRKKLISITRRGKEMLDRANQLMGEQVDSLGELNSDLVKLRQRLEKQIASI